jgi:hypothetical protein
VSDKVISLADRKKAVEQEAATKKAEEVSKPKEQLDSDEYFKQVEAKNKANAEKQRKEKLNANKSVLRSYRIKD